jgi:endoribonuclease LACTB2
VSQRPNHGGRSPRSPRAPLPPLDVVNVGYDSANHYVLGPPHARLLVDVGLPGTLPKLLATLRRKDVPLQAVRYLLVTHYHPDHAGIAQDLKRQGVRLVVLDVQRTAIPSLNAFLRRKGRYGGHGGSPEITLHDNVDLRPDQSRAFLGELGITGEIVPTPGHSDDSVTLALDGGAAFTGDLPPPGLAGGVSAAAVALSWSRLRALGVRRVHPGHGPARPLPGPEPPPRP